MLTLAFQPDLLSQHFSLDESAASPHIRQVWKASMLLDTPAPWVHLQILQKFGMQNSSEDARKDPCPTRTHSEPLDMSAHVRGTSVDLTVALSFLFLSFSLLLVNFLAPHTCIGLESQVPLAVSTNLRLIRPYEPCTLLDGGVFVHWKFRLEKLL